MHWFFKGDLRWFEKIAQLNRCFNKQNGNLLCMCHLCMAGGEVPFEDFGLHPEWEKTAFVQRPWLPNAIPGFRHVPFERWDGGSPEKIMRIDLFHVGKVGVIRDLLGSTILFYIKLGYFRGDAGESRARDACLDRAHAHFFLYCRTHGMSPGLRSFSAAFFSAPTKTDYGWVNCKAADSILLLRWLSVATAGFMLDPLHAEHVVLFEAVTRACKAALRWQNMMASHGLWLRPRCAMVLFQEFHSFMECYNFLAFMALRHHRFTGYALKSKTHLLGHLKQDLYGMLQRGCPWLPNPGMHTCDMNEDVVGKVARLSRRVSTRRTSDRTLRLVLVKSKAVHDRYRKIRAL